VKVTLDRVVDIKRPVRVAGAQYSDSAPDWQPLARGVWVEWLDEAMTRDEADAGGMVQAGVRARVRMRYRTDVDVSMRFDRSDGRVFQIIGGPVELGRREWIQFRVQELTTAGASS
jgi:head-tail adaptor